MVYTNRTPIFLKHQYIIVCKFVWLFEILYQSSVLDPCYGTNLYTTELRMYKLLELLLKLIIVLLKYNNMLTGGVEQTVNLIGDDEHPIINL